MRLNLTCVYAMCFVGIVVSCNMGEGSILRREMVALAQSIATPRRVPIAVQSCDTLEKVILFRRRTVAVWLPLGHLILLSTSCRR